MKRLRLRGSGLRVVYGRLEALGFKRPWGPWNFAQKFAWLGYSSNQLAML